MLRRLTREDKFGLTVTVILHLVMLLTALFMVSRPEPLERAAFINFTLADFQDGAAAEFSREEEVQPVTQPEPVETEVEEPEPEPEPEEVPQPEPQPEEATRDVELPEQEQEIESEVVITPDTEEIDPMQLADETEQEEEQAPPITTRQDEEEQEGEEEPGDIRGIRGRVDVDQGTETDPVRSSPFQLEWDGDINRSAVVQPLPEYVTETEAVIRVRFEVRPDGTVENIRPLLRGNPELDREVIRTLRTWRFSRLPPNVPQENQSGTITFRFILE